MKRAFFTVLAAILFLFSTPETSPSSASMSRLVESSRPLQITGGELQEYVARRGRYVEVDLEAFYNICSSSLINRTKRYWLTAAHCIADTTMTYYIDGQVAQVVMRDVINDVAILSTPTTSVTRALKLARSASPVCVNSPNDLPSKECRVAIAGYPFGLQNLDGSAIYQLGTVLSPEMNIGEEVNFAFFAVTGAPGNSGSPVVNHRGEVISVIQIGFGRTFGPVMGGIPFRILERYKEYFQR